MLVAPFALSDIRLSRAELATDKKGALIFDNCSLGKKALYLGFWAFDNARYLPLKQVERVYKRLAISKGYYEGKSFGTISYLMVVHDGGKLTKCRIPREEDVDRILDALRRNTDVPVGKP